MASAEIRRLKMPKKIGRFRISCINPFQKRELRPITETKQINNRKKKKKKKQIFKYAQILPLILIELKKNHIAYNMIEQNSEDLTEPLPSFLDIQENYWQLNRNQEQRRRKCYCCVVLDVKWRRNGPFYLITTVSLVFITPFIYLFCNFSFFLEIFSYFVCENRSNKYSYRMDTQSQTSI